MVYPMCRQTVTLYRNTEKGVLRRVISGCFYRWEDKLENAMFTRKFLLIQPGQEEILPGDRIYDGVGPENVDWERFIPVQEAGLSQVEYATPWRLDGEITHWEAGRK